MAALSPIHDSDLSEIEPEVIPSTSQSTTDIIHPRKRARHGNGSECIEDSDLNKIGSGVGPNQLQDIARSYLNVPEHDIETYEASARGDIQTFKFKILEHWRNKNHGPDARKKLFDLLEQARKDAGLIDRKCYWFLVEDPEHVNTGEQSTKQHTNYSLDEIGPK